MPNVLRMPEVAANAEEAILQEWTVGVGDTFAAGDVLATIETDKALVDYEAETPGVLLRTLITPGSTVAVGTPIAIIGATDESPNNLPTPNLPDPTPTHPTNPPNPPETASAPEATGAAGVAEAAEAAEAAGGAEPAEMAGAAETASAPGVARVTGAAGAVGSTPKAQTAHPSGRAGMVEPAGAPEATGAAEATEAAGMAGAAETASAPGVAGAVGVAGVSGEVGATPKAQAAHPGRRTGVAEPADAPKATGAAEATEAAGIAGVTGSTPKAQAAHPGRRAEVAGVAEVAATPLARVFSSPLARRLAGRARIPVAELTGSGPGGRIVRRDVEAAMAARESAGHPGTATAATAAAASGPNPAVGSPDSAVGTPQTTTRAPGPAAGTPQTTTGTPGPAAHTPQATTDTPSPAAHTPQAAAGGPGVAVGAASVSGSGPNGSAGMPVAATTGAIAAPGNAAWGPAGVPGAADGAGVPIVAVAAPIPPAGAAVAAAPGGPIAGVSVAPAPGAAVPRPSRAGSAYTDVPHSRMRRVIAERLGASKRTIPHFYLRGSARVDRLLSLRRELNETGPDGGTAKVSVNDLVVKAVARAHTLVPAMNVIWTPEANRAFASVDVAVAIATDTGLVTPVLRDVERTTVTAVAGTIADFAVRARAGRLRADELAGGTITVTNLGMFGVEDFAAIINPPHAAILAVGAARPEPVVEDGALAIGTVLRVTLAVDHRPVDGVIAAQWLRTFLNLLEHPLRLLA